MKKKIYTLSHDIDLLKRIDNNERVFTGEEHASIMKEEFGETIFKNKARLIRHFSMDALEPRLIFVSNFIKNNNLNKIISLGAGPCVNEYFLNLTLPEDVLIVATDFDEFLIKKAKEFLSSGGGVIPVEFGFINGQIESIERDLNLSFDLAIFFSSSYVMNDKEFVNLFSNIKKSGIKNIIDCHGSYIGTKQRIRHYMAPLAKNPLLRKMFRKSTKSYNGKFHGYIRSKDALRKLYIKSGWDIKEEHSLGDYKYCVVLNTDLV